jgi:hypothetical protein
MVSWKALKGSRRMWRPLMMISTCLASLSDLGELLYIDVGGDECGVQRLRRRLSGGIGGKQA